jgi:3',5'-cyclic-AMP phosphodiesterase
MERKMSKQCATRRDFLAAGLAGAAASVAARGQPAIDPVPRRTPIDPPATPGNQPGTPNVLGGRRSVRIAHLTDIHLQPERDAAQGFAKALQHVQNQSPRPSTIITGGDLIMDGFDADEARTKLQWELFQKTLDQHCELPIRHCLGNHDIWGWNKEKSKTKGTEPKWGKQWFREIMNLERTYYAFTLANWRIIVLDTVQPRGEAGYEGGLDDDQFAWLKGELGKLASDTHALLVSHIPIINISTLLADGDTSKNGWDVSPGLMCLDARRIVSLLAACPNVKAAISGHIHTTEDVMFQGVRYLNNGAVSGAWWKSQENDKANRRERGLNVMNDKPLRSDPGYALLDLSEDGEVACRYVGYGWEGE